MKALERAGYLAHLPTAGYRRHLERAQATIRRALELCQRPYLGWSAGKDSSAMLWLLAEQWPEATVRVLTGGETRLLYPSIDRLMTWWREQWPGLDLQEINIDHVFAEGWEHATWVEQWRTFFDEWDVYLHAAGDWDGVFIGLRADESNKRRLALARRIEDCPYAIWRYSLGRRGASAGRYRICPLDQWTTQDVAALHAQHDIPLLESYEFAGLEARTHLRTGNISLRMGQLVELRQRDPRSYNRLIARFPELAKWGGG